MKKIFPFAQNWKNSLGYVKPFKEMQTEPKTMRNTGNQQKDHNSIVTSTKVNRPNREWTEAVLSAMQGYQRVLL